MSRPQKIHKPIKAPFDLILAAVGVGSGAGKRAATKLAKGSKPKKKQPRHTQ